MNRIWFTVHFEPVLVFLKHNAHLPQATKKTIWLLSVYVFWNYFNHSPNINNPMHKTKSSLVFHKHIILPTIDLFTIHYRKWCKNKNLGFRSFTKNYPVIFHAFSLLQTQTHTHTRVIWKVSGTLATCSPMFNTLCIHSRNSCKVCT